MKGPNSPTPPLVVLGQSDNLFAIWHVHTGPTLGLSRLIGAWVLGSDQTDSIRNLAHDLPAVHCTGIVALPDGVTPSMNVDVDATVHAIRAEIDAADQRFAEHQATVRHRLVRPPWPPIHHPDTTRNTAWPEDKPIGQVLSLARGLARLAGIWAEFEAQRLRRKPLIQLGGPHPRPMPLKEAR